MSAPNVNPLPASPSRLSRPSNFVTEATVFLEALPTYRSQVNFFNTYINSNIVNKYNFGTILGIRTFPNISQVPANDIIFDGDNISFTSALDSLYSALEAHSLVINSTGVWYDSVLSEVGSIPYDLDKPITSGVSQAMTRNQSREDFNETAQLFTTTNQDNINSLFQSIWYTYSTSCGDKSCGLVTDTTIISFLDGGSVTDHTITY